MDALPIFLTAAAFVLVCILGKGRDAAKQAAEYDETYEVIPAFDWPPKGKERVGISKLERPVAKTHTETSYPYFPLFGWEGLLFPVEEEVEDRRAA